MNNNRLEFFLKTMLYVSIVLLFVYLASQSGLGIPVTSNASIVLAIFDVILVGINVYSFIKEIKIQWKGRNFSLGVTSIFCCIIVIVYVVSFYYAIMGNYDLLILTCISSAFLFNFVFLKFINYFKDDGDE